MSTVLLAFLVLAKIIGFLILGTVFFIAVITAIDLYEQRRLRRPAPRSTSGRNVWRRPSAGRSSGPMKASNVENVVPIWLSPDQRAKAYRKYRDERRGA